MMDYFSLTARVEGNFGPKQMSLIQDYPMHVGVTYLRLETRRGT
jgi:hypothetical protein